MAKGGKQLWVLVYGLTKIRKVKDSGQSVCVAGGKMTDSLPTTLEVCTVMGTAGIPW